MFRFGGWVGGGATENWGLGGKLESEVTKKIAQKAGRDTESITAEK